LIIAYDLRYACDHFAGIGNHAFALLDSLLSLPGDDRFLVIWNPKWENTRFDISTLRQHPRVEWVECAWHPIRPDGAWRLGAWLRARRPDIYLSPFGLRPFFSGVPEVLTIHDVSALRHAHIPSWWKRILYRASLLDAVRAQALLTVSAFSRREILALLPVDGARVHAVPNGVPRTSRLTPSSVRPAALLAERFALVVSDNRPRKNLEVLAHAWADAELPLALVGVGHSDPRFPSLASLARRAPRGSVETLGWVSPEELAWLYEHATVLLLPSRYEGFGFPLLEAMQAGVPAVVSDIPVFREVGGDAPRFADPEDPAAWRREVLLLCEDRDVRDRVVMAGRHRAESFSYKWAAERTREVLEAVHRNRA
jgi:glycosyltransferase involved in cell wall biosynthesis